MSEVILVIPGTISFSQALQALRQYLDIHSGDRRHSPCEANSTQAASSVNLLKHDPPI